MSVRRVPRRERPFAWLVLGLVSLVIGTLDGLFALGVIVFHWSGNAPYLPAWLSRWVDGWTADGRWYSFESGLGFGSGLMMLARYGRARRAGVVAVPADDSSAW